MVKVTLPEQQRDKKVTYPYFAKSTITGAIYYVTAEDKCICVESGKSVFKQGEYADGLIEKYLSPIYGKITLENVFE